MLWRHGINLLLGAWLIAAPFTLGTAGTARTNEIVLGVAVLVLTVMAVRVKEMWVNWLLTAAGVWLIVAPFVFGYTGVGRANDVLMGFVLAGLNFFTVVLPERTARLR
ncbi:MAG: SPW repeat protein [Bacillota bacterium]|uniref:SPW repeat domain-containing protein n=1 Tax=Desulforudis sp. DRI-14 TaxID=3459793 RepID=UPI003482EE0C